MTLSALLLSCGGDDPLDNPSTPTPTEPVTPPKKGYPTVTLFKTEVNVFGGAKLDIKANQLYIQDEQVASWTDESNTPCKVSVKLNGENVNSGDVLEKAGKLSISVTNEHNNTTTKETDLVVKGATENFTSLNIKVGEEVNLLDGITFVDGVTLVKTEMEVDDQRQTIADPTHFTPKRPGSAILIFTVQAKSGSNMELKYEITIKPMDYQAMDINHLQPKDILPVVGQINSGDKNTYEHIKHLRIAECTRVRDMMWQYGAGKHTTSEYQKLIGRLFTGMIGEKPAGFDNFEMLGKDFGNGNEHGHDSWDILCSIVKHAKMIVMDDLYTSGLMSGLYNNSPSNAIFTFATSSSSESKTKEDYIEVKNIIFLDVNSCIKKDRFLWFLSGSNLQGRSLIKICQEDIDLPDNKSIYSAPQSQANNKNDAVIDKHIMITVATNKKGDVDVTNAVSGSKYPVGFHPDILFSGRSFPYHTLSGNVYGEADNYKTSHTNYTNLALTDLCFQLYAEVADVNQLLKMIRATALTDYTHLDGQTQNLYLINPAGFFQQYLMPKVPASVSEKGTTALQRGYYHGVVFNIPGAEVNINGEWVPFNKDNQERIKEQNPFSLQWRLNGELLAMMGYTHGKTVTGQLIAVDDQWNGLNITQDVTITIN